MSTKYFNFNNESNLTEVDVHDETGVVTFTLGEQSVEFATIGEFAEYYATARNVLPDNLKNWVLTEDGDQIAFVLRAGTAGMNADEVSALATGLRAAGMSPEEIGRAIAAASTTSTTSVDAPAVTPHLNNEQTIVQEWLNEQTDLDIKVLLKWYECETVGQLINELASRCDVEDDWDLSEDEYFEAFMEEEMEEIVIEINHNDINEVVAKSVYAGFYGDQSANRMNLERASLVAAAASRHLQVVIYNSFSNETTNRQMTYENVMRNIVAGTTIINDKTTFVLFAQ